MWFYPNSSHGFQFRPIAVAYYSSWHRSHADAQLDPVTRAGARTLPIPLPHSYWRAIPGDVAPGILRDVAYEWPMELMNKDVKSNSELRHQSGQVMLFPECWLLPHGTSQSLGC